MKISEILLNQDIPSNEIRARFKNNQIRINGIVTNNIELDVNENFIYKLGPFLCDFCSIRDSDIQQWISLYMSIGYTIDSLFSNPKFDVLEPFILLRVGKFDNGYVLMKN